MFFMHVYIGYFLFGKDNRCISKHASDFNNSLPKSITLQHLHEGNRHVFKANSDHFLRLQLALQ